jgi:glycosyltransferase involved in cell wall biosynthesis
VLSVILCTHQPRPAFFRRTLDALAAQTLARDLWELLIVDNASTDALPAPEAIAATGGHVIREDTLGLTAARRRGIQETHGDLLVFVDDDNLLAPDYLAHARAIAEAWPVLGAWGGQCLPEFETPPEEWTREYWNWIGLRSLERDSWSNVPNDLQTAPFGAGLCVRRPVAEGYERLLQSDRLRSQLDRTGGALLGGGDSDFAMTACDLGLGTGVFARLQLTHLMPRQRLEEGYLLQLVEAMIYSHDLLRSFRGTAPTAPRSRAQRLLDFYEALWISPRERRFDAAKRRGHAAARRDLARVRQNLPPLGVGGEEPKQQP